MNQLIKLFKSKRKLLLVFSGVFGVILVWRGIWGLMDLYLFPDHPEFSYLLSIIFGFFILLVDDLELEELNSHRAIHPKKSNIEGEENA
jgi:hypothetical protein